MNEKKLNACVLTCTVFKAQIRNVSPVNSKPNTAVCSRATTNDKLDQNDHKDVIVRHDFHLGLFGSLFQAVHHDLALMPRVDCDAVAVPCVTKLASFKKNLVEGQRHNFFVWHFDPTFELVQLS